MYLHEQLDHTRQISPEMRRRLHIVYLLAAAFALTIGTAGMVRVGREVGRPFGGFLWGWDPGARRLAVVPQTPAQWEGPQRGMRGGDLILAVDDRDPLAFSTVYKTKGIGEEVAYLVDRNGRQLIVRVPISRFTIVEALESFGVMFLTGISALLAGYFLVQGATDQPTLLIGFSLLTLGGAAVYYTHNGGISRFYVNEPATILLFIPSYPLTGALLFHFFLIFPRPLPVFRTHPRLRYLPYSIAGLLIPLAVGERLVGEIAHGLSFVGMLSFLTLAILANTARSLWTIISTRLSSDPRLEPERHSSVAGVSVAFSLGLLLVVGFGVLPFFTGGLSILLSKLVAPVLVLYPLLLLTAVRNVELIQRLRREIAVQQQLEAEARELRRFREEDLRRVANELHDTVLAGLRAVELRLESLIPGDQGSMAESSPRDQSRRSVSAGELQVLLDTMRQIRHQARQVTMGVMPLDIPTVGLREALEEAVERFRRMAPGVDARLEVGVFDAEPPPAVREAAYWIAVSALNNCREHAHASRVRVFASVEGRHFQMVVQDDGVGFQGTQEHGGGGTGERRSGGAEGQRSGEERGLGLRNMKARAAEVGGELEIESGSRGATVRFSLTLPRERSIRVLVIEDSEAFVAGLEMALARWAHEIEIVGVAASTQKALSLAQTLQPDIVLVDLRIRETPEAEEVNARHGLQVLLGLSQTSQTRSVVMSFTRDPAWLRAASEMGAWAFWSKDEDVTTLVDLLRRVAAGERLLSEEQWLDAEKEPLAEKLSPREWEMLFFLEQGLSNQEIAGRLGISVRTVEKHVENVLGKLRVHSRLEAVAKARELGLLSADRPEFPPPDLTG